MALVLRGRSNVLPGAVMFTLFGFLGQSFYNKIAATKDVEGGPKKGFWQRMADRKWSPVTVLSNEEYAAMLRERQLKIDVEIALIDDKIAALRKQEEASASVTSDATMENE